MSWPVPGTLMIEPTESENKQELDRFCDALIAIRSEVAEIESGDTSADENILINAPHTHLMWSKKVWSKPYSMQRAFFPIIGLADDKYWPPVGRIDNAYGDRNLVCTCPFVEDFS